MDTRPVLDVESFVRANLGGIASSMTPKSVPLILPMELDEGDCDLIYVPGTLTLESIKPVKEDGIVEVRNCFLLDCQRIYQNITKGEEVTPENILETANTRLWLKLMCIARAYSRFHFPLMVSQMVLHEDVAAWLQQENPGLANFAHLSALTHKEFSDDYKEFATNCDSAMTAAVITALIHRSKKTRMFGEGMMVRMLKMPKREMVDCLWNSYTPGCGLSHT